MNDQMKIPFQQLIQALLDENSPLNPRFLYRLSDLDEDELDQLLAVWTQIPVWRRRALFEDLEVLGESDYLLSFEGMAVLGLDDPDPKVRTLAIRLLWEYEEPALVPIFVDILKNDPDEETRSVAATALGRYVYLGEVEELAQEILHALEEDLLAVIRDSESPVVRRHALESLGYSSRPEIPPIIEEAYLSTDKEWVAAALFAMGRSANEEWEPQVLAKFNSPHPIIRMEAARAAGELSLAEAIDGLIEMLDDDNDDVRLAAIWSLSQIGGQGVRDILEDLAEKAEDEEEIEIIENALDNLSFTEDVQLFTMFDFPPEGSTNGKEARDEGELYDSQVDDEFISSEDDFDEDDLDDDSFDDTDFDDDDEELLD